jgi:hypothetical protein
VGLTRGDMGCRSSGTREGGASVAREGRERKGEEHAWGNASLLIASPEKRHILIIPRDFGGKAVDHISGQSEGVGIWRGKTSLLDSWGTSLSSRLTTKF